MDVSGSRCPTAAALLAVLVLSTACTTVGRIAPPPAVPDLTTLTVSELGITEADAGIPSSVRVVVRNENLVDVRVYAVSGYMVIPIGRVERFGEKVLRIPDFCHVRTGVVRLMADPVGYRRPVLARPIRVGPGSEINWVLKSRLTEGQPGWRSTD